MKRRLFIILVTCIGLIILSLIGVIDEKKAVAKNCECNIMVECYYPGYKPGIDTPFASRIVYSCAEVKEYTRYISETTEYLDEVNIHKSSVSPPVFFYIYSAQAP